MFISCFNTPNDEETPWLWVIFMVMAGKCFGCSLKCLWLRKPVLEFLCLVNGLGQSGVMKRSLNQLEAFLPLQL